ncbi:hypothetical protein CFO_g4287 [Ceratocystis platani]|uniref:EF-hand domain-containing protein n=1 Tax=Ceratocystis fimbriata f. sp. platani TaxID=88771 RepID=A0A0F8AYG0_CERFI|nr:hypothetical protein CFO_g4287 [Ceratocystis platani]
MLLDNLEDHANAALGSQKNMSRKLRALLQANMAMMIMTTMVTATATRDTGTPNETLPTIATQTLNRKRKALQPVVMKKMVMTGLLNILAVPVTILSVFYSVFQKTMPAAMPTYTEAVSVTPCESQGLHNKNHVFLKIKVPVPPAGLRSIQPVLYTGDPDNCVKILPKAIINKLCRETGFERSNLEAHWERWTYMANTEWREDPDDLCLAMDRKTFDRCIAHNGTSRHLPPNLVHDRMFAFFDQNGDGLISFREYLHGLAYRSKKERLRKVFDGYDIDGDGYVDRKDFLRMFRAYFTIFKQIHKDILDGLDTQVMSLLDTQQLITARTPLSSFFGRDESVPHADLDDSRIAGKALQPDGSVSLPSPLSSVVQPKSNQDQDISQPPHGHDLTDGERKLQRRVRRRMFDRWKRRQFYLDVEEGGQAPSGWDSDEDIVEAISVMANPDPDPVPFNTRRDSTRSRSSSKVRFADQDDEFETRSNASTSSRSIPERWGGFDIPEAERDLGKEILYLTAQEAYNEILDVFFKEKEDLAVKAAETREFRHQHRDLMDTLQHHGSFKSSSRDHARDPRNSAASHGQKPETISNENDPAMGSAQHESDEYGAASASDGIDQSSQPTSPTSDSAPRSRTRSSGNSHQNNDNGNGSASDSDDAITEILKEMVEIYRDPTMPQFRPNNTDIAHETPAINTTALSLIDQDAPKPLSLERKTRPSLNKDSMLRKLHKYNDAEIEAVKRRGFGKLSFAEFEKIYREQAAKSQDRMEYLETWIDIYMPHNDGFGPDGDICLAEHLIAQQSMKVQHLYWVPVILVYSFAAKSSQVDMLTNLRNQLEQLDIKFLADYHAQATHIVTRKRNTPKGLQALINGKYMVTNSYVDTIVAAAGSTSDTQGISLLEQDYSKHWPKPEDFVPPKGNEAIDRPPESFLPDAERQDVFKGYTFVFYDEAQHRNLMAPISSGKGKALLYNVDPQTTRADDLVQYVKTTAGETGIGEFDDGSVGPGVVVVRYVPTSGEDVEWYTRFITDVSLCLNHRAIEQSEFIEAILTRDATFLRRPLPADSSATTNISTDPAALSTTMLPPQHSTTLVSRPASAEPSSQGTSGLGARGSTARGRKPATRRFKGFDSDNDDVPVSFASQWQSGLQSGASTVPPEPDIHIPKDENQDSDDGLFVPEGPAAGITQTMPEALMDDSLMDEIAPTAALAKRQRLENGEDPAIVENDARPEPEPDQQSPKPMPKQRKIKKELDVLEAARKVREQEEARLQRERDDMAQLPDDIDLLAIRQLHVVEEIPLRQRLPVPPVGSDADSLVASGRWDPRWNGRRNFKRFRVRGDPVGRVPMRTIVSLTQVKTKDFGIGDDYWLEEHGSHRAEGHGNEEDEAQLDRDVERPGLTAAALQRATHYAIASESESDDGFLSVEDVQPGPDNDAAPWTWYLGFGFVVLHTITAARTATGTNSAKKNTGPVVRGGSGGRTDSQEDKGNKADDYDSR